MVQNLYSIFLLVFVSTHFVQSQLLQMNPCISKENCHECIQVKSCVWCFQPDFGDKPRCIYPNVTLFGGGCSEEYIFNPENEEIMVEKRELSQILHHQQQHSVQTDATKKGHLVQIYPQRIQLNLRYGMIIIFISFLNK